MFVFNLPNVAAVIKRDHTHIQRDFPPAQLHLHSNCRQTQTFNRHFGYWVIIQVPLIHMRLYTIVCDRQSQRSSESFIDSKYLYSYSHGNSFLLWRVEMIVRDRDQNTNCIQRHKQRVADSCARACKQKTD